MLYGKSLGEFNSYTQFGAGEEGFEPSHAGIKIRCLNQLGDSPTSFQSNTAAGALEGFHKPSRFVSDIQNYLHPHSQHQKNLHVF